MLWLCSVDACVFSFPTGILKQTRLPGKRPHRFQEPRLQSAALLCCQTFGTIGLCIACISCNGWEYCTSHGRPKTCQPCLPCRLDTFTPDAAASAVSNAEILDNLQDAYNADSSGMLFWEVARSHRCAARAHACCDDGICILQAGRTYST